MSGFVQNKWNQLMPFNQFTFGCFLGDAFTNSHHLLNEKLHVAGLTYTIYSRNKCTCHLIYSTNVSWLPQSVVNISISLYIINYLDSDLWNIIQGTGIVDLEVLPVWCWNRNISCKHTRSIAADGLTRCVVWSPAITLLTILWKRAIVLHNDGIQLFAPPHCYETIKM